MCDYLVLARSEKNSIKWCKDCDTYCISYNNIVITFTQKAFQEFKQQITDCYSHHAKESLDWDRRDIVFNTRLDGVRFLFSTNEVKELLSLIKNAEAYQGLLAALSIPQLN